MKTSSLRQTSPKIAETEKKVNNQIAPSRIFHSQEGPLALPCCPSVQSVQERRRTSWKRWWDHRWAPPQAPSHTACPGHCLPILLWCRSPSDILGGLVFGGDTIHTMTPALSH